MATSVTGHMRRRRLLTAAKSWSSERAGPGATLATADSTIRQLGSSVATGIMTRTGRYLPHGDATQPQAGSWSLGGLGSSGYLGAVSELL